MTFGLANRRKITEAAVCYNVYSAIDYTNQKSVLLIAEVSLNMALLV